jgi:hypothetical protein
MSEHHIPGDEGRLGDKTMANLRSTTIAQFVNVRGYTIVNPIHLPRMAAYDVEMATGIKLCELLWREPFPQQLKAAGLAILSMGGIQPLANGANAQPCIR